MNIFAKIVFIIFLLGINVLGARGTIKTFPLNIEMAAFSTNQFINQLSINGVHALQKAIQLRFNSETREGDLVVQRGFKTPEDAFKTRYYISNIDNNLTKLETYMWRETPLNLVLAKEKPNVVVILVESLGSQWLKLNSPSFNLMGELAKHFNTDPVFYNFLSSDRGTIGSLMALTTNLPTRPGFAHFTESKYLTLKFPSGAQVPYELNNYETSFLYGGDSSWRGIGKFMHNQGYTNVEGAAEIEKAFHDNSDLRHVWGVHDEYLYKYLAQKLTKATKPQFIFALSTTNHPPYKIPDNYQPLPIQFPEILTSKLQSDSTLVVERMRAFQYSCQKLGEFLTELKASPLGENTIVAITGDHNFWSFLNYNTEEVLSQYGVPFYLYVPQKLLPKGFKINSEIFGSQIDIMPTLYNLSLSQTKYIAMGENLLLQKPNVNVRNYAFNSVNQVLGKEGALLDGKFYTWNKDIPGILNKEAINSDNIRTFDQYYGATLAVTDYYIKTLLVRKK